MNNSIKKAFENGRLIIFLGAGASFSSKTQLGHPIPLAVELSEIIAKEIGLPYENESLSEVYQAANEIIGNNALVELLCRYFKNTRPSDDYRSLVSLPLTRIYTLNIDDCIEKSFYFTHAYESKRTLDVFRNNDQCKHPLNPIAMF